LLLYNKIKLFGFFYQFKQLTDYIYTDTYCKLSKCIGQTPCSYEHYIVIFVKLVVLLTLSWHEQASWVLMCGWKPIHAGLHPRTVLQVDRHFARLVIGEITVLAEPIFWSYVPL